MQDNLIEMVNDGTEEMLNTSGETKHIGDNEKDDRNGVLVFEEQTVKPETQTIEETNKKTSESALVTTPEYSDVMLLDYEPETEEELIDVTKALNARMTFWQIGTYWMIGCKINGYYARKGNYGKGTLERIALDIGIGIDTLRKILKFARVYNESQLKTLLDGPFLLRWNHIAQNLTLEAESFVEAFKETTTPGEFHRKIMDCKKVLKGEVETQGAATNGNELSDSETDTEESRDEDIQISQHPDEREPEPVHTADIEDAEEIPPFDNSEEIEVLNDMLEDAKTEIEEKDKLIQNQNTQIEELSTRIKDKDWIIEAMKREADGMKKRLEEGTNKGDMLQCLEEMQTLLAG